MIEELRSYPAYRDSGVPWLGELPEHWSIKRLKAAARNVVEQTVERQNGDLYIALEHVESWTGRLRAADPDLKFDSHVKRFLRGDVLFGKLRPYLAKITCPSRDGVCVGEFLVVRPRSMDLYAPYLERLLRSKPFIDAVSGATFGAKMPRADWESIGGMPISLPRIHEQRAIVRFLDYADRRIRKYIAAKRKLIALLEEQKRAIIDRAVTRGLDPNVRLKDSGVPWIGMVPEHWTITRFKALTFEAVAGPYGSSLTKSMYTTSGYRVYGQQQVIPDDFTIGDYFIGDEKFQEMRRYRVFPDDILISVMGTVGRVAVVPATAPQGIINPRLVRYRVDPMLIRPRYAQLAINAEMGQSQLREAAKGTTMEGLNMQILGRLQLALPPVLEQETILAHIADKSTVLRCALTACQTELQLVNEYRTRLISDVVTGKIDVREAAAMLPDEPEDKADDAALLDDATDVDAVDEEDES